LSGDYAWQEKACQNVQKVQGSISIMVVEHPSQVTQNADISVGLLNLFTYFDIPFG
jgi:hypothetical protein